jgi:hypothetical protein
MKAATSLAEEIPSFGRLLGKDFFHAADEPELYVIHHSLWSAVYRRSFLDDNHVRCPEKPGRLSGCRIRHFTMAEESDRYLDG